MSESEEELKKRISELESRLEEQKERARKGVYLKVSAKGGVSLYGIRRFPITFYLEEWNRILEMSEEIRTFLREHDGVLFFSDDAGCVWLVDALAKQRGVPSAELQGSARAGS